VAEGRHVLIVQARDAAGNLDPTPASWVWRVDRTPPATRIEFGRMQRGAPGAATFEIGSTERVTFTCSLDGQVWTPCASPVAFPTLGPGRHILRVRSRDSAGNTDWGPAIREWAVSRSPSARGVVLTGGDGDDLLIGTPFDDIIEGRNGDDVLLGRGGNDTIDGGRGDDRLDGGRGNDRLTGSEGRDLLRGGTGRDVFFTRDGERDTVLGGPGRDRARVDRFLDRLRAVERRF
jgi:large repetitive protein